MDKRDLLFYDAYEDFYATAGTSHAFCAYCRDAFGEDFSQDGFSDLKQVEMILPHIPVGELPGHSANSCTETVICRMEKRLAGVLTTVSGNGLWERHKQPI